jgi:hypothetical protein
VSVRQEEKIHRCQRGGVHLYSSGAALLAYFGADSHWDPCMGDTPYRKSRLQYRTTRFPELAVDRYKDIKQYMANRRGLNGFRIHRKGGSHSASQFLSWEPLPHSPFSSTLVARIAEFMSCNAISGPQENLHRDELMLAPFHALGRVCCIAL